MAKKEQRVSETLNMSEAGEELMKKLVVLYDSQIFVREGKNLREELMLSGVEAGAALASVDLIADRRAKVDAANRAVMQVNKLVYIANAMLMLGRYSLKQVQSLLDYCNSLLRALKNLLHSVPQTRKVIRLRHAEPVPSTLGSGFEEYVPEDEVIEPSGFEDYEGDAEGFDDPV